MRTPTLASLSVLTTALPISLIALASLSVLALAGCSSKSRSSGDLLVESDNLTTESVAEVLSGNADLDAVLAKLARAVAFDQNNVEARLLLGVVVLLDIAEGELAAGGQGDQLMQRAGLVNGASGGSLWDLDLEIEDHGQGLFKDSTPTLNEFQGYFNNSVRPALDALATVLDTVPSDWEYVIPAANGGLLLQRLAPGQTIDLRIDYGDVQIAAAAIRAMLGLADVLGAFDPDNFAPNDIDFVDNPNLDLFELLRTQYANFGNLLNAPSLQAARNQLTTAWQNYGNASAWIRAENAQQQQQGLLTIGRQAFGDPTQTQAFLTTEANVRQLGQRLVDGWFSDANVLFDVDLTTGQTVPVQEQAQVNLFRFFSGIDVRDLYFKTVVDPSSSMRMLGVESLSALTQTMASFQGVVASIGGETPTAGDLQELLYSLRIDSPAISTKVIDGNFGDWVGGRTQVGDAPAAYINQPAPDLGRHYVARDSNALYVYLDSDLTPALLESFDSYRFEVSANGYTASVRYQFGTGHQAYASTGPAPTFAHNANGLEIRFPIASVTGEWLELERETEADNTAYEFDSNPTPVFVKIR